MLSDAQLIEMHHKATDDAMHAANRRDGFGSNMSRESIAAGLRAVEAAVRADQIEKDAAIADKQAGSMPINSSDDRDWANWKAGRAIGGDIRAQLDGEN